ncbi:MAG: hypothetical protein JSR44_09400 [Spirochaetes bacterium]|nr:hypothetical protein [Spirochaetota bacterium]
MRIRRIVIVITFFGVAACQGPDIGSAWPRKDSAIGETQSPPLAAPIMIYPIDTYQTTSRLVMIKAANEPTAVSYTFEALSGTNVIAAQTLTAPTTQGLLTLPMATYGNFTIRMSYISSDSRQSSVAIAGITVRDFSAGTLVKQVSYASHATCAVCSLFFAYPCPSWNFPLTCPGSPNNNLSNCDVDSFQGGGNGWVCGNDPNANYLAVNNSNSGAYLPTNAGYNYAWQDSSMMSSSYQENHVGGATDEAIIFTCRMKFASECPPSGNDTGTSFFLYPYRDPTSSDNVEIKRRSCDGNWASLSTARVATLPASAKNWSTNLTTRLDCLGNHITAYYKSGIDFVPMVIAQDTVKDTGKNGWAIGPGGVTTNHHRVTAFEWRHW